MVVLLCCGLCVALCRMVLLSTWIATATVLLLCYRIALYCVVL